ncbi:MAG: M3 family oligoendopeptidase [Coprobacillus sp.]|nr:M3 family oligoendopeptidase [Coprobacillus sp.]
MPETSLTFEEYVIHPINQKKIEKKLQSLVDEIHACTDITSAKKVIKKWNKYTDDLTTDFELAQIRYTIDTRDEVNVKNMELTDEVMPYCQKYANLFTRELLNAPYRADLEKWLGSYAIKMYEQQVETFDDSIMGELAEENRLVSEYQKLIGSAQIEFNGEVLNLSQLGKYTVSSDRETRRAASLASANFFAEHDEEFEKIYDDLVHVRTSMAHKLGYETYTELGYKRLGRMDYNPEMVAGYRDQIYRSVVPLAQKLYKDQMKGLGIKNPQFYDYNLEFTSGNPKPIGTTNEQVKTAEKMYDDLHKETGICFHFMENHHLFDLDAKAGKSGGGYCTYIPRYESPFIFANNNGTQQDIETLTHEFGHAFQFYCSRGIKIPEYRNPTLETCEIHSMSMEFLTWPYMNEFFGEDTDKYKYTHLKGAIQFLPYGVLIDEFQHWVYANPDATHMERCAAFREMQKKYTPQLKFDECPYLEHGGYWVRQSHVFMTAFYYIDYTLAQVVSFEFLASSLKNREKTLNKYVKLCKYGGKSPFVETLEKNHLRNPFIEGNVEKAIKPLRKILKEFDTSKF